VGLIGALFGTLLSLCVHLPDAELLLTLDSQTMAVMWIYDNRNSLSKGTVKHKLLMGWNIFIIVIGTFIQVAGCYGSGVAIHEQLSSGATTS
jgi:hypothetical protein